jgi:hypothetical protein
MPESQMENMRGLVEEFNMAKQEKSLGKRKRTNKKAEAPLKKAKKV